jgi:glycosyltransferase involved in cell wall biosynthesis
MAPCIAYLVTEDWAFMQHRLPMARAARDAGFEVHVLTRVEARGDDIAREGFKVHPINWRRAANGVLAVTTAIGEVRAVLRAIRPDVLHNVAIKPAVVGSLATIGLGGIGVVNSIVGMGSAFLAASLKAQAMQVAINTAFRILLNRRRTLTVVQNPDDRQALERAGVRADRIVLIPGSGVDTDHLPAMPEPPPPIRAAFVGRMLEDKGVRPLIAAQRLLRAQGVEVELLLCGEPDPDNPTSIAATELAAWGREPGIVWRGFVKDIREIWACSQIAVLPSRREGLPKTLLEAAACARPMVATDAPGCREVAIEGETGLLVPIDDAAALAAAIARLAGDAALRRRLGRRARELAETRFSSRDIGRQTVAAYRRVMDVDAAGALKV